MAELAAKRHRTLPIELFTLQPEALDRVDAAGAEIGEHDQTALGVGDSKAGFERGA